MTSTHTLLCRYRYDPLDRLATCSPTEQDGIQRFYQKNRLTTEIQGQIQQAFFQTEDQLLAQHQGGNTSTLLATDQQRSVLDGLDAAQRQSAVYTPYGARHPQANPLQLLGFTGERADPVTGHYLLGNGYRAFNPVLRRFNSPDSLSPFGKGGLNAYAYCAGDPVNRVDPTGHIPMLLKIPLRALKLIKPSNRIGRTARSPSSPEIMFITRGSQDFSTSTANGASAPTAAVIGSNTQNWQSHPNLSAQVEKAPVREWSQKELQAAFIRENKSFERFTKSVDKYGPRYKKYIRASEPDKPAIYMDPEFQAANREWRDAYYDLPPPPSYKEAVGEIPWSYHAMRSAQARIRERR